MVGYDRQEREFVRIANGREGVLFLADGSAVQVLEQDGAGLAQKIRLRLDAMTLTFQRGVGIVEARMESPNGPRLMTLDGSRVGDAGLSGNASAVPALPAPQAPTTVTVAAVTAENPRMHLEAAVTAEGVRMALTVANASDRLLPFRFNSGQSFDFVVSDASGREIWRWSLGRHFTAVIRSEALRADETWRFEEVWDRKDRDGKTADPGEYTLAARLASQPPIGAAPVRFALR
jgi:hypothetical protein